MNFAIYGAASGGYSGNYAGYFPTGDIYMGGNVGIGDSTPTGKLQVTGDEVRIGAAGTVNNATGDGDLYVQDALEVDGTVYLGDNVVDLVSVAGYMELGNEIRATGSAASDPAFTVLGDDDTGIFFPDADTVGIANSQLYVYRYGGSESWRNGIRVYDKKDGAGTNRGIHACAENWSYAAIDSCGGYFYAYIHGITTGGGKAVGEDAGGRRRRGVRQVGQKVRVAGECRDRRGA